MTPAVWKITEADIALVRQASRLSRQKPRQARRPVVQKNQAIFKAMGRQLAFGRVPPRHGPAAHRRPAPAGTRQRRAGRPAGDFADAALHAAAPGTPRPGWSRPWRPTTSAAPHLRIHHQHHPGPPVRRVAGTLLRARRTRPAVTRQVVKHFPTEFDVRFTAPHGGPARQDREAKADWGSPCSTSSTGLSARTSRRPARK